MGTSRTCAITGADGFVGRHLASELAARNWQIVSMGRDSVDFANVEALTEFLIRHAASHVVHLAAESNPSTADVRTFYESNAFLTERLLMASAAARLPGRFLYVSASSVYGDGGADLLTEEAPWRPQNHYGASKLLAEVFADWYRDRLDITIARPSNCVGRGQRPTYLVPKLVAAFADRKPQIVMGDLDIARDFVDIRDAVDIIGLALEAAESPPVINVASGRATQIRSILSELVKLTGHQPQIRIDSQFIRQGDIRYQACDITRALTLGHAPRYRLDETLSWMLSAAPTP